MITTTPVSKLRYSVTNYKGKTLSMIPNGFGDLNKIQKYEARWGMGKRNNDPSNPRIPKIGDKIKLDIEFSYPGSLFNGAVGIVSEKFSDSNYCTFEEEKTKETCYILPSDIQWYF